MLLDTQSPSGLLSQVIEIIGILPNRVCVCGSARSNKLMNLQLSNCFPSETEGAEFEDGDVSMNRRLSNYCPSEIESAESEDGNISLQPQLTNYFPSETEGAESEDGDISMDWQFSNHFLSETVGAESEDGDISMDQQFSNHFPSETEGVEYEDRDIERTIYVWGTEMPKWFNHLSVENSIFFWVGRRFPKLAVCVVCGPNEAQGYSHEFGIFYISINGCEKRESGSFCRFQNDYNLQYLHSPPRRLLQQYLNESNPTDQNHVTYSIQYPFIKRWGVHVECTCPPHESLIPNLPLLTAGHDDDDVVDYLRELPFFGCDDKEEYQSPLVHDDISMSCMSWLIGATTKLFKIFCFCCPRDFS
ncbi:uncharacterized protein LOC115979400 [Quercus lobata]|uniref:uncharacterized protein LOC115979400 n=1 Tax=Quercus lobata TaxID=97700 RepID=UPI001247669D|nr:uncharacterized protein LOC115979400 [Quercus lobata]XP_030957287.1 uncharacterized protein LOC115979400 [Quercus lobata]XP_030957288.1 uncharacterized protein LOC115979400 [Quercus lobata]